MREKHLLMKLIERMTELKGEGKSNYDILMFNVSDEIQELALSFGEKLAIRSCLKSLDKLNKGKSIMKLYYLVFAWEIIMKDMPLFLLEGWMCPDIAKKMRLRYNDLIKDAAQYMEGIVKSLNVPTHAIYAPIAHDYVLYNEKPYYGEVVKAKM